MGSRLQVLGFGLWGGPQKVAFGSVQFGKLLDSFGFCCRTEPISAYARPGLHERDIQRPPVVAEGIPTYDRGLLRYAHVPQRRAVWPHKSAPSRRSVGREQHCRE